MPLMKIRHPSAGSRLPFAMLILVVACSSGCDGDAQSVRITAQDFRFAPDTIHLSSSRAVHLTVYNEGRESHEFQSPLFADRSAVIESLTIGGEPTEPGRLRIAPGRRLELVVHLSPGTYLFFCKVKGHSGMTGMFIVE
jgi:uncharacterized cupredoxin-like copper-binding protein